MGKTTLKIHLATCISVDFDRHYLPHFFNHYKDMVDKFHVICHSRFGKQHPGKVKIWGAGLIDILSYMPKDSNYVRWSGEFLDTKKVDRLNEYIEKMPEDDWVMLADVDEFHSFGVNPRDLIERHERDSFFGKMIDRTSKDGIKSLDKSSSIFEQFPIECTFTEDAGGCVYKPLLFKKQKLRTPHSLEGVHWEDGAKQDPLFKTFHFKWVDSTKAKLEYREALYKELGKKYWKESRWHLDRVF